MERPIILKAHEVRGILDGRQTQLRRILKPQPVVHPAPPCNPSYNVVYGAHMWKDGGKPHPVMVIECCPFGQPGERLWVRETWGEVADKEYDPNGVFYEVKGFDIAYRADRERGTWAGWKSPVAMPRWASRILLEIVSVRVERLQDISDADCIAEGMVADTDEGGFTLWARDKFPDSRDDEEWKANPFVWVVEFKRVGV